MNDLIIVFIAGVFVGGLFFWWKQRKLAKQNKDKKKRAWCGVPGSTHALDDNTPDPGEKIMDLFKLKDKITNNDVEDRLGVSDATATRHLQKLEDQGLIEQIGKTGSAVHYVKK